METETQFRVVTSVLFIVAFSMSAYFRRRAQRGDDKISPAQEGTLILTLRRTFGLALWLSVLLYLIYPKAISWGQLDLPLWLRGLGLILMALCLPVFYWIFSSLDANITSTVVTRKDHTLVVTGPYGWVRHPLYTTGTLFFLGFSLVAASWFTALLLILESIVLDRRTSIEERQLIARFGDNYLKYMEQTGRYLPKIRSTP